MAQKLADTAKLFWSGRSQAVRLPKEYRFEGTAVRIHREGDKVILEPANDESDPWAWLDKMPGEDLDPSFVEAVESLRREDREAPDDEDVAEFFK